MSHWSVKSLQTPIACKKISITEPHAHAMQDVYIYTSFLQN